MKHDPPIPRDRLDGPDERRASGRIVVIALLDNGQDLDACEAEIGVPVGQLLTPLTRYRPRHPRTGAEQVTEERTTTEIAFGGRDYITRLRRDPRTKAMHDGWVAQATVEAELRYPHPMDADRRAHFAASRALELGMAFVLDNDGELNAVREQMEHVLQNSLELARLTPGPIVLNTKDAPK